ncbi:MAG: hypothetical protein JSW61_08045 [Candidatus Thorarchaeota archaeon]|nr:MAG: hypothetical protein JSW61_08045 [Candidatus Thorarchaeota archaeon]
MNEETADTLRGIVLTEEGKIPITKSEFISSGPRADVLAEPARAAIIEILREGMNDTTTEETLDEETGTRTIIQRSVKRHALSVVEIVRLSRKKDGLPKPLTKSQVYHHLGKLIEAGYVILFGTLKKGKRTTDYYRRVSELYIFESKPGMTKKRQKERITKMLKDLSEHFGFTISEKQMESLVKLRMMIAEIEHDAYKEMVRRARGDLADPSVWDLLSETITIYTAGSSEYAKLWKAMRDILFEK